jgi:hypothetical protein
MERNYINGNSNTASLFVGREIEKTPAYGLLTLFVVGMPSKETIFEALDEYGCSHIYFGANQSFNPQDTEIVEWEEYLKEFLNLNIWVTLDFDLKHAIALHECCFNEYNNFIPMISVKIPYVNLFNYNACLKIDDIDFAKSNPGVWVHYLHNLKSRDTFTNWAQYSQDKLIK